MVFKIIQPVHALRHVVEYFWTFELTNVPANDFVIKTFVDDSSGIIIQNNSGKSAIAKNGIDIPGSLIYGQTTVPTISSISSPFSCVGVLFRPTAINMLFGVEAHYLTDRLFSLDEFAKNEHLSERIISETDANKKVNILSDFIFTKLGTNIRGEDKLVSHAIHLISTHELTQVKELISHFRISERQLERRFSSVVGVSPRHYIQAARFKRVINFMRHHKQLTFSDIAYELKFSDQPHFTRLIRKYAGLNPKELKNYIDEELVNVLLPA